MYKALVVLVGLMFVGCQMMEIVEDEQNDEVLDFSFVKQTPLLGSDGRTLYLNVANRGVDIIDISDVKAPKLLKNYDSKDRSYALARLGNYLFVADGSEGLLVLDVAKTEAIYRVGYYQTRKDALCVSLNAAGTKAAVGTKEGVEILDISTPTLPRFLGRYVSDGAIYDALFSPDEKSLYLANFAYGVESVDITKIAHPILRDRLLLEGSATDIAFDPGATRLYVATLNSTLKIVDIQNPDILELLESYDAHDGSLAWSVQLSLTTTLKRAYLAKGNRGFSILDLRNPLSPLHVGGYDTNGTTRGLVVDAQSRYAYVADGIEGLKIFDIKQASNPVRVGVFGY